MDELSQLSPDQQRQVMLRAQMEANESVMRAMMDKMTKSCFEKCAGTSVSSLSFSLEQIHDADNFFSLHILPHISFSVLPRVPFLLLLSFAPEG